MSLGRKIFVVLLGTSLLLNVFFVLSNSGEVQKKSISELVSEESSKHPLLSKRSLIDTDNDLIINFTPLRESLNSYAEKISHPIGVYFEYLPSGVSIGVNDQLEVKIASLVKVPAIMAVYREIENGKLSENTEITMSVEDVDQNFGSFWKNGVGSKHKIKDLVSASLKQSDNTATNMLVRQLPEDALGRVFNALDLPRVADGPFPILSPKSYASVLRNLYLASFNNSDHSSAILQLLTSTDFNDKLPAGIPKGVNVAHKIGTFDINAETSGDVFSDCGIIYGPRRPFILCIMSQTDEATARGEIQYIAKMVYGYVAKASPSRE